MRTSKARTGHSAGNARHRRWSAYGKLCRYIPKAGAVCGNSARTDLKERLGSGPLRFKDPRREAMLEPEEVFRDTAAQRAGLGRQTDCPGAWDQPQHGEGLHCGGRLDGVPAAAAQEGARRPRGLAEGAVSPPSRQCRRDPPGAGCREGYQRQPAHGRAGGWPYRQELAAEARATVRFETPPGKQLQIDFDERLVEIAGSKVRAYLFVATLGYSRRQYVWAFRNERQESWFDGLESAFARFGGVTED